MIKFLLHLLAAILAIIAVVLALQMHHNEKNAQLCFDSKWNTREFEIINHKLYCKADNGMQMLKWREL
jgi:hypothetical protein